MKDIQCITFVMYKFSNVTEPEVKVFSFAHYYVILIVCYEKPNLLNQSRY